jgi:feruloyl esterase
VCATAAHATCEELIKLNLPTIRISFATLIKEGQFASPSTPVALPTPTFCRVAGVARPSADSDIHFEVWIPPRQHWNQYLKGVGNGGYGGAIDYTAMAESVRRGFAVAATDTGHTGGDLSFGFDHPERIIDWADRAVHVTTQAAKEFVRVYIGTPAHRAVFVGCSTGGQQALAEVQRYPTDYDGVIAGDPGNDRVHLNVGFLWAFTATHDEHGNSILPLSKLSLINHAALAACDAVDGVKDGIISAPERCRFDPGALLCKSADTDQCLTAAQVVAVRKVYAGPRNPRTGAQIIAGYSPGSESPDGDSSGGWKTYIVAPKEPMRLEFWRRWVYDDPAWDWHTFDYDRGVAYADEKMAVVNAADADLHAYRRRGGKIIMYSGWADPIGPPMDAVNYYRRVEQTMGGRDQTQSFLRLFMVPGMAHCGGGPGPSNFGAPYPGPGPSSLDAEHDIVSALLKWIDTGVAPERIIAAHVAGNQIDRTRPLCPYPKIPRWNGTGNSDEAESFSCAEDRSTP